MIVGIDEVGRGPWAGPLVMGAVVLGDAHIEGLTDSKKLSKTRRTKLATEIKAHAKDYGLGWVHAEELDELGLSKSLEVACRRALEQITVPYHEIIIDGTVNFLKDTNKGPYVTTMKKADLLIASVSAASILAKVARDDWMAEQEAIYPHHSFASHVGYGTAVHRSAIDAHGLTPLHRRSFAPIAAVVNANSSVATSKQIGDAGESIVAEYLRVEGYDIRERNWKTKLCEIDIVALKNTTLYFVEVKHRESTSQGGGIAAITPKKLRQMRFAATLYLNRKENTGLDARLMAATTRGTPPQFESCILLE